MNILFLSSVFPDADHPSRGTYNLETCLALTKKHSVRVVSPRPWADVLRTRLRGRSVCASDRTLSAELRVRFPTFWYPPKVLREKYGELMSWSAQGAVERWAAEFRPDAILGYWAHPDGEAAVRAGRRLGVPVAVITGGSDVLLLPKRARRGARVRSVLKQCDAVLTVSNGVRRAVINLGVDAARVHTVYQGVDDSVFHPGDRRRVRNGLAKRHPRLGGDRPMLLWVGRMVDVKRLDVLIDGCAELRRRGTDFILGLIGTGPLRGLVEDRISKRELSDNILLLGALPPQTLGVWYRAADLTVLTSDSEGLPNVLRESLACGTPFVSTDVGSVRELADDVWSALVPPGDPVTLATAIAASLERCRGLGSPTARPRTWNDRADEITQILQSCRAEGAPSGQHEHQAIEVPA